MTWRCSSGSGWSSARIVLADATKIGRVTLAQVCRMAEVDVLITDCRATQAQLEALRGQGAAVACV